MENAILEDGYTEINDDLVLAGRDDAAWGNDSGKASTEEILEGVDRNKYIIPADGTADRACGWIELW